jgi:alpha-glucosidase
MSPTRRDMVALTALGAVAAAGSPAVAARARKPSLYSVVSPDGRLKVEMSVPGGTPSWRIDYDGKPILLPSALGLWLAAEKARLLGFDRLEVIAASTSAISGTWSPLNGQSSSYDRSANELTLLLHDQAAGVKFAIIVRAMNGAAALRYRIDAVPKGDTLRLSGERTLFQFPQSARVYTSRDEGDIHLSTQDKIAPLEHPDLTGSSDSGGLADLPLTVDLGNGLYAIVAESDRMHFPRCMAASLPAPAISTYLMTYPGRATGWGGPGDTPPEPDFDVDVGQATPWRVIMVADSAKGLIERHHVVPTLATPNQLDDVSWIRAGHMFRIMKPYSTEASLRAVDFAKARNIKYVLFDAHWYGDGTDASEPTYPIPALDLQKVIDYGKTKGVGVVLYIDRVAVTRALEDMCRLYQKWGVAGVKLGFMWEGRQVDVDFIYRVVKAFGEHGMVVNLHDNLRPAGLETTLPNYLTLEGVKGNEQFPPARHNVNLAFTRSIVGPIDYTICYAQDRNQTTNAHQLALAVTCYSPLSMLYWYDKPEKYADKAWPELSWFDAVPTTWDETRAIAGEIGEYVIIARRRGDEWYLGAITNEMERRVELGLSFLGQGNWTATRYMDGNLTRPANRTPVAIHTETVTSASRVKLQLNAAGGQAIRFTQA